MANYLDNFDNTKDNVTYENPKYDPIKELEFDLPDEAAIIRNTIQLMGVCSREEAVKIAIAVYTIDKITDVILYNQ